MQGNTKVLLVDNAKLMEVLRSCIDLPKNVTALDLRLRLDQAPTVTCSFNPTFSDSHELDVSTLDDTVRRWVRVG